METEEECQHEQTRWLEDKVWKKGERKKALVCCDCGAEMSMVSVVRKLFEEGVAKANMDRGEEVVAECGQPIEEARPCCDGRSGVRGCFECSFAR